ncbi:3-phosphoshikimate 1-carboxyvinyltransferase [Halococcus saccharolyticus]|uniref:3-phosphoshikimate 1-carboxyvinyltransferase n=1 Tax=Halococcus saccharolyticus DSM 5350 TaxID=1227455 RepID=M0MNI5_9EURY|nr:3-phosphoshikimate 1-carboxyvinyltransferase [Halococcus saccharolyticus]EMA47221.1 3-phosphoshikimate 1-carboxyvinyltransferase [Halococcus saccharolyticus DSM 5350]
MDAEIRESAVGGRVDAPPSKSYTHRAILAAGYTDGETVIERPLVSADTRATMRAVEAYGGTVTETDDELSIQGFGGRPETPADVIDCANSGTTIRLTTAAAALGDGLTVLTGDGSLRSRPHGPLLDAIHDLGGRAESTRANGQAPLVVGGPIEGGTVSMPGDVSSQFVTALLMAGAHMEGGIEIGLETELKSAPYVEITREVLADFGIDTRSTDAGFAVADGQSYAAADGRYRVPGDFSSISYLLAAGALAADDGLEVHGAYPSAQGDAAIVEILDRMGAEIAWDRETGVITVRRSALSGVEVDVGDTPDLLPTLAVLGAAADDEMRLVNAEHVRYKETDRVSAMADELAAMGARVEETPGSLTVHGGDTDLRGARVDGRGDHRIVMALAVAGLIADGGTTITGSEHVDVSFPDFFGELAGLGADVQTTE